MLVKSSRVNLWGSNQQQISKCLLWNLPEFGIPPCYCFVLLITHSLKFQTTKWQTRLYIFYSLSNAASSQHSHTSAAAPKWEAVKAQIAQAPDWHCLLTIENGEPGYRGVLESWSRLARNVRIIISANRVDILMLVISFPGAEATSLLWKFLQLFL